MPRTKHVVSAADDHYAQHLGVMLTSLLERAGRPQDFCLHVIDSGISEANKRRFRQLSDKYGAALQFLPFSLDAIQVPVSRHINHVSYMRLFLTDLLPDNVARVLYLDCDMVVMQDPSPLWALDLAGNWLAAVDSTDLYRNRRLGLPDGAQFFNAGLLFVDLEQWRRADVRKAFLEAVNEAPEPLQYHDQDVLNMVLHDKWLKLPPKWNVRKAFYTIRDGQTCYSREQLDEAIRDPAILHYTEAVKPWHYLDNHPHKDAYRMFLDKSPWQGFVPGEKPVVDRIVATRSIVLFGSGSLGLGLLDRLRQLQARVACFIDNDAGKWGTEAGGIPVRSPDHLLQLNREETFVWISSMYYEEIERQLDAMGWIRYRHYCSYGFEGKINLDGGG